MLLVDLCYLITSELIMSQLGNYVCTFVSFQLD